MVELVKYMVCELVDDKDSVVVTENGDVINVTVSEDDMGKVIGKQGRIAKALRTIIKAVAARDNKKCSIEIIEAAK